MRINDSGPAQRSAARMQSVYDAQNAQATARERALAEKQAVQANRARQEAEKSNKPTQVTPATSIGSHVNTWA